MVQITNKMLSHKTKKTPDGVFFVLSMVWGSVFEPASNLLSKFGLGDGFERS